jgi:arylsulfatase
MKAIWQWLLAAVALSSVANPAMPAPSFPQQPSPPPGAPNVLVIMTDDVGFAASSTMGGGIPTPTLDRLAANGIIYNNFHTTALCSPTRAALLTGRNPHAVGFGTVADLAQPEPGYNSILPKSAGTLAQVLGGAGYDTAMFGKHHNVPTWQLGSLGPFDQWPSGLGFRYFYGFNAGDADQFAPALIENNRMIEPPDQPGYILDRDLADHAVAWLQTQRTQHPGQPFLLYYAPGTTHWPLHAPAEWIARFKGKFDSGWDAYREAALARQKKMGLVPANTQLAPMPDGTKRWSDLSPDERTVAARYMEVYAAALAFTDNQIGRIIDELQRSGQMDNTLVMFIQGDNGSSGEGGPIGAFNALTRASGASTPAQELAYALAHLDELGGPRSYPVGPVGWGAAMNTPFPYYKIMASRLGGIRNAMVVSWPARLKERGVRSQFAHVTDVMPTILEATGVGAPGSLGGVAQRPFDGVSLAFSFAQPKAPSRHHTQYFEIFGNASIYHDGWLLAEAVQVNPANGAAQPDAKAPWQLYDLTKDFSQARDVAAAHPEKVAELRALWDSEARRNQVLPLVTSNVRAMIGGRPEPLAAPGRYTLYPSTDRYPEGIFPRVTNRSWSAEADLEVPTGGGDGVLVTQGGHFAGWALAVLNGLPTSLYRASDREQELFRLAGSQPLAPGRHRLAVSFTVDGPGFGKGGVFVLKVDGHIVAHGHVERTIPFKFGEDATIGRDAGTTVSDEYRLPFPYSGKLNSITMELGPLQPPPGM